MELPRSRRRRFTRSALVFGSVAVVVAAGMCYGPSRVSLADPDVQVDASMDHNIDFPKYLTDKINYLKTQIKGEKDPPAQNLKKSEMLQKALNNLTNKNPKPPTTVYGLSDADKYKFNPFPLYFSTPFVNNALSIKAIPGYYDYKAPDQLWVDFANRNLGGGVFGDGLVQEETMMLEMPQLANAAAKGFKVRSGTDPGPLKGDPEPLVFDDVWRTVALAAELYGRDWYNYSLTKVLNDVTPIKNQQLNVLAMAVPSVKGHKEKAKELDTIDDLFNTFVAGYTLAKAAKKSQVNTGNIGTGDFENDQETVYVMQKLALQYVAPLTRWRIGVWVINKLDLKKWSPISLLTLVPIKTRP